MLVYMPLKLIIKQTLAFNKLKLIFVEVVCIVASINTLQSIIIAFLETNCDGITRFGWLFFS